MKITTLCYMERQGAYLMLHRVVKENDENHDKWIGVGGKLEPGESPDECLTREVREETGCRLNSFRFRGLITFVSDLWGTEYMCLYTSDDFDGDPLQAACDEGVLEWVDKSRVPSLNLWEGDKIFLRLLQEERPFFSLKLVYSGDALVSWSLDGREMRTSQEGSRE